MDRTPACIKAVLDKPGKYKFVGPTRYHWYFEVDDQGRVYQLRPDCRTRDGLLSKSGWNDNAAGGKVEPIEVL